MATLTLQRLKKIIGIAYENGYHGCLDLKDSYTEEVISKLLTTDDEPTLSKNDGWKIYRAKELITMAIGTIFEHCIRGRGYIEATSTNGRIMRWSDGTVSAFLHDESPWLDPMRRIGVAPKAEIKKKRIW